VIKRWQEGGPEAQTVWEWGGQVDAHADSNSQSGQAHRAAIGGVTAVTGGVDLLVLALALALGAVKDALQEERQNEKKDRMS
jgi:hypothetical protein